MKCLKKLTGIHKAKFVTAVAETIYDHVAWQIITKWSFLGDTTVNEGCSASLVDVEKHLKGGLKDRTTGLSFLRGTSKQHAHMTNYIKSIQPAWLYYERFYTVPDDWHTYEEYH